MNGPPSRARRRLIPLLILLGLVVGGVVLWIWWAESHPREERQLRVLVQDQLRLWFPEAMVPVEGFYGLIPRILGVAEGDDGSRPRVLLVHGLDEPGSIWDDLIPALGSAGFEVWEFRYPNDQGVDRSTDLLADVWPDLPADRPVVLVGHSMGGLVVRDFLTRWRHPVATPARVEGAAVRGVILVGTPSQGSEWARLRIWLELRDQLSAAPERRFSLFAGLRDGAGEAKIDLRPGSDFLDDLNGRAWDESIPIRLIGGLLTEPSSTMADNLATISVEVDSSELAEALQGWWSEIGKDLGDGVVPIASLPFPGAPAPLLVSASHRGMLARFLPNDPEPPAIAHIVDTIEEWAGP
jgi:pimeloyl-ACP methyl ester carboxylesterase